MNFVFDYFITPSFQQCSNKNSLSNLIERGINFFFNKIYFTITTFEVKTVPPLIT